VNEQESDLEPVALGDRAWRAAIAEASDRSEVLALLRGIPGVQDVVIAEGCAAVYLDDEVEPAGVREAMRARLAAEGEGQRSRASATERGGKGRRGGPRTHRVPVAYDGEDLAEVARSVGASVAEVVAWHAGATYDVAMLGFMPGFAYLRGLDRRLVLPRRTSPRTRVSARSVAIAANYTGIYPSPSPGGWHLLGEAIDFVAFDDRGAAFAVGDRVQFEPIARAAHATRAAEGARADLPAAGRRWLEVTAVRAPALLVDHGRRGHMHEGVPQGGPLVRGAFARANAATGSTPGACAVELYGAIDVIARGGRITVAGPLGVRTLDENEAFTVAPPPSARAGYLAVRGGIDVPPFLGSRTTLLSAQRGGLHGRPLARGSRLIVAGGSSDTPPAGGGTGGGAHAGDPRLRHLGGVDAPIALLPGPDPDPGAFAALLASTFTIALASDRTGTRLVGPPLPGSVHAASDRRSGPMVRGAIELTPAGPIVLGPDHPTTGGYPIVAVLRDAAQDTFFALPLGSPVGFA